MKGNIAVGRKWFGRNIKPGISKLFFLGLVLHTSYNSVHAQEVSAPPAEIRVDLCGTFPQTIPLPDLVLLEVNSNDFTTGKTEFQLTVSVPGVELFTDESTTLVYSGTSQSFSYKITPIGPNLSVEIDLAANSTQETLTLSGAQLVFDAWDFNDVNIPVSFEIDILDPVGPVPYSFTKELTAYSVRVNNAALTPGSTQISGTSGTYVHCTGEALPTLTVDGNQYVDINQTGAYQWQWQYLDNIDGWMDLPNATAATYQPPSLLQDRSFRRKTVGTGGCSVSSNPLLIKVNDYLPGSISFEENAPANTYYSCEDITIRIYSETLATALDPEASLSYQWYFQEPGEAETIINGATEPHLNLDTPSMYADGTEFSRRAFSELDGEICSANGKVSNRITLFRVGTLNPGVTISSTGSAGMYEVCEGASVSLKTDVDPANGLAAAYSWELLDTSGGWIPVANGKTFTIGAVPSGTFTYHRRTTLLNSNCSVTSEPLKVIAYRVLPGAIALESGGTQVQLCENGTLPIIRGAIQGEIVPQNGIQPLYSWEISTNDGTGWSAFTEITGSSDADFTEGSQVTVPTRIRRRVRIDTPDLDCQPDNGLSNVIEVTVYAGLTGGTAAVEGTTDVDYVVCEGETDVVLEVTGASTPNPEGSLGYRWERRDEGATTWVPLSANASGPVLQLPSVKASASYRRVTYLINGQCEVISDSVALWLNAYNAGGISWDGSQTVNTKTICADAVFPLPVSLESGAGPDKPGAGLLWLWQYSVDGESTWTDMGAKVGNPLFPGPPISFTGTIALRRLAFSAWNISGKTWECLIGGKPSNVLYLEKLQGIDGGVIDSPVDEQTLCSAADVPLSLTVTDSNVAATAPLAYQWEIYNTATGQWQSLLGETGASLVFTDSNRPTATTRYQRATYLRDSTLGNICVSYTQNEALIQVFIVEPGQVEVSDSFICYGEQATISDSFPAFTVPDQTMVLSWEATTDLQSGWNSIAINQAELQTAPLFVTTYYRRVAESQYCEPVYSNTVVVNVLPEIEGGSTEAENPVLCSGETAGQLSVNLTTVPIGAISYQWFQRGALDAAFTSIANAQGATYTPPPLTTTTYFYREAFYPENTTCSVSSSTLEVRVNELDPGSITGSQVFCPGVTDVSLSSVTPGTTLLNSQIEYEWEQTTTVNDPNSWVPVTTPTSQNATLTLPTLPPTDTHYRRRAQIVGTNCFDYTNVATLQVITNNGASNIQFVGFSGNSVTLCAGPLPALVGVGQVESSAQQIAYKWYASNDSSQWNLIAGASDSTFQPGPSVGQYAYYKREVVLTTDGVSCILESNVLQIELGNPNVLVDPGSISATDVQGNPAGIQVLVCPGDIPNIFLGNESEITYDGDDTISIPFTYQWYRSTDGISYTPITGATDRDFAESIALNGTTYYGRSTIPDYYGSACDAWSTNFITVLVPETGAVNIRSSTEIICPGDPVQTLVSSRSIPQTELTTMAFQWYSRVSGAAWTPIVDANNEMFTPAPFYVTTSFKRTATYDVDGDPLPDCFTDPIESNEWTIRVNSADPGRITYNGAMIDPNTAEVCFGALPELLISDAADGYSVLGEQVRFNWQSSSDGSNWTDLGVTTQNLQPPVLQQDTWFRRNVGSLDLVSGLLCWSDTTDENVIRINVLPEVASPIVVSTAGLVCSDQSSPGFLRIENFEGTNLSYTWYRSNDKVQWEPVLDGSALFGRETLPLPQLFETTYYRVEVVPTDFSAACSKTSSIVEVPVVNIDPGYIRFLNGPTQEHYQATCTTFSTDILIGSGTGEAPTVPGNPGNLDIFWESSPGNGPLNWTGLDLTVTSAAFIGGSLRIIGGIQSSTYLRRGIRVPSSNGTFCIAYSNPILVEVMDTPQISIPDPQPYITDVFCSGTAEGSVLLGSTGAIGGDFALPRQQQVQLDFLGTFEPNDLFTVILNGVSYTVTAQASDDLTTIAAALENRIATDMGPVTATVQQNSILLSAETPGTGFTVQTSVETDLNARMDVFYIQANHPGFRYSWRQYDNGIPVADFVDPGTVDLTAVTAGNYQLTVTNLIDCTAQVSPVFTITEPDLQAGLITSTAGTGVCFGADIVLTVSGGSNYANQAYQWEYSLDDGFSYNPIQIDGVDAETPDLFFLDIQQTLLFRRTLYLTDAYGDTCSGGEIRTPPFQVVVLDPSEGSIRATEASVYAGAIPGDILSDPSIIGGITGYYWEATQDVSTVSPNWTILPNVITEELVFNVPLTASTKFRRFSIIEQNGLRCVSPASNEVIISVVDPPVIDSAYIQSYGVVDVSCYGAMDGSITLDANAIVFQNTGPDPDSIQYKWIKVDDLNYTATGANIEDLGPGSYQLELTLPGLVLLSNNIVVREPDLFAMDLQASCNGTLETNVSGGSGSYQFSLTGPNGGVQDLIGFESQVFPNLIPGGTYTLIVDDLGDRSCPPIEGRITIPLGLVLDRDTIEVENVSCFGSENGSILVNVGGITVQGGVAPYQMEWISPTGASYISDNPTQLGAGTYVLNVTDQLGCNATLSVVVGSTDVLEISRSQVINQQLSCSGVEDASIAILIQADPNRPYQIDWYRNGTSIVSNVTELKAIGAGVYRVEVFYLDNLDGSCLITQEFEIQEPEAFSATLGEVQEIGCDVEVGGAITVTAQGGTLPYRVSLDGAPSQNFNLQEFTLSGVAEGNHQLTLMDANGCNPYTFDVTLVPQEPLSVAYSPTTDQQPINCDNIGSLSVVVSGGQGPYFYEWTGPSFSKIGMDLGTIDGLTVAGTYTVKVTDAGQCESTLVSMDLEDNSLGFGLNVLVQDVTCLGPNDSTAIEVSFDGDILAPYTILWESWSLLDDSDTSCISDCYGWRPIPNAEGQLIYANAVPGDYRITVRDNSATACATQRRTVTVPEGILQIKDPVVRIPQCDVAEGQLLFSIIKINPVDIYLNGNLLTTESDFLSYDTANDRYSLNSLAVGDYDIEVRERASEGSNTTCSARYTFAIAAYNPIKFTGTTNFSIDVCEAYPTFSLPITSIAGGNPFDGGDDAPYYNFDWRGPDNFGMTGVTTIPVKEGEYQLVVSDASGCTSDPILFSFTNSFEPITVDATIVQPGCGNSATGAINIFIEGGRPVYDVLWERELIDANGSMYHEELARGFSAINELEAGRYRLTVTSNLPSCSNDNPAKQYSKTFALGGVESLGLVEAPALSASLCGGEPGVVRLKLFDTTGSEEGGITFYYDGAMVVSDYTGDGWYEVFIERPIDDASLTMVNTFGCQLRQQLKIGVPDAQFSYSSATYDTIGTLPDQEEITFRNETVGDFTHAIWNFGDGVEVAVDPFTQPFDIQHTYEFSGTYEVTLEVFNVAGCSRSTAQSLQIGLGYQILFPNAFTPNGDGMNEYFEGEFTGIEQFELFIYTIWGGLITSMAYDKDSKPAHWGWDGNYGDGTPYAQKYFRYVFKAQTTSGELVNRSGEAVILR